jgi:hypothetical protein
MVKFQEKTKIDVSKKRQNELAIENATRDEDHIYYDYKTPLVINEDSKILEVFVKKDYEDEEDEIPSYEEVRVVRIVFKDKEESETRKSLFNNMSEKVPYTLDIVTSKTLEEIEEALCSCENEEDIEDIEEMEY